VRAQGKLSLWLKNMSRIPLLILDDFGLIPMTQNDQPLLLELVEDRYQRGSLIINSQLPNKLWHDQFADKTLADAIMDRIVHNAEKIELKGESMRKKPCPNKLTSTTISASPFSFLPLASHAPESWLHMTGISKQGAKIYYRVFSGEAAAGKWLTAVPPRSSGFAQEALALPPWNSATMIQEVRVPSGTMLERSRAIPVPDWGRFRGGAEQFQLLERLPEANYSPRTPPR